MIANGRVAILQNSPCLSAMDCCAGPCVCCYKCCRLATQAGSFWCSIRSFTHWSSLCVLWC
jgi:hypothetical protein